MHHNKTKAVKIQNNAALDINDMIKIDDLPVPYQSLNKLGEIIRVNQAWLDTLGYTKDDAAGKWFGDFLMPESKDYFKKIYWAGKWQRV